MMLFAFICFVLCLFLCALWCVLWVAFGLRNGSRQRRMERDARIFHARQKFYQDKAKWN